MIEKKIRKFFNSVSVPSCNAMTCEEYIEGLIEEQDDEIEVTPDLIENDAPSVQDYIRFMAKTFCILASAMVIGKTIAFLVSTVSGEEDD